MTRLTFAIVALLMAMLLISQTAFAASSEYQRVTAVTFSVDSASEYVNDEHFARLLTTVPRSDRAEKEFRRPVYTILRRSTNTKSLLILTFSDAVSESAIFEPMVRLNQRVGPAQDHVESQIAVCLAQIMIKAGAENFGDLRITRVAGCDEIGIVGDRVSDMRQLVDDDGYRFISRTNFPNMFRGQYDEYEVDKLVRQVRQTLQAPIMVAAAYR